MRRALIGAPVLALLCVQIGLFIWMAGHGLDLTDESYYLLSYQHWRDVTATATFFGAYFDLPFRWLGGDVAAMRMFGLALLVTAGGFLTWCACTFGRDAAEPVPWPFVAGGMTGALFYYSYVTTLRAPSYNLLVLFCMLVASALMLVLTEGRGSRARRAWTAFAYGLMVGMCALTKATSALAMVVCHLVFLARFAPLSRLPEWVACALVGIGVNVLALQSAQPHWLVVLREGVVLATTLDPHYTSIPFATLWDAALRGAIRLLPALVLAALVFAAVVRRWGRAHRAVLSGLVVLLVAGIMLTIQRQGYGKSWWVLLAFGTALLWLAERLCRETALPRWRDVRGVAGLSALLFALPICYSIGTNGSLPAHTQMAAVFAVVALMLPLRRLHALGLIHGGALATVLALPCLPMLVAQLRSLSDPVFTYRLRSGLMDQQLPMALGPQGKTLGLDAATRDGLAALTQQMAAAGYRPGEPIIDATGDGPGLVYALGGRPLGVAWIVGGYPGSERVAARVLDSVSVAELRNAWMLSADDNPRALRSLPKLLRERTGEPGPQRVGGVRLVAQYRWDGLPPELVAVTLWKPSASARISPEPTPK
jgi:hypothetical protein